MSNVVLAAAPPVRGPRTFAIGGEPGIGKTRLVFTFPTPAECFDTDEGTGAVEGTPGWTVRYPAKVDDIIQGLLKIEQSSHGLRTVAVDGATSTFALAKADQRGEPKPGKAHTGDYNLNWAQMMGGWQDVVRLGRRIARKHGLIFVVTFHPKEDYALLGKNEDGSTKKKLIGWRIDVPGQYSDNSDIIVPFDEVYLLQQQIPGIGPRTLVTDGTPSIDGLPFRKCKTRFGVPGPIQDPTFEKITAALAGRRAQQAAA